MGRSPLFVRTLLFMIRIALFLASLLCLVIPARANQRAQGDCMKGGVTVTTNGIRSTQRVMQSFVTPSTPGATPTAGCTVNVYNTGTSTLATIYSDNSGTALANPFTADASGHWFFYGQGRFDVTMSGAGIATPFTLGDIQLFDIVSVSDYGALCDGSTDDTTPIQNAINGAVTLGAQLVFPAGTCVASILTIPSNSHWIGQGYTQSVLQQKLNSGVNNTPFIKNVDQVGGDLNIYVERMTIDGGTQSATNVQAFNLVSVTNVTFDAMAFNHIQGSPIYGINWTNFKVKNSRFENYGATAADFPNMGAVEMNYASASAPSSNISITDNFIDGSGAHVGGVKVNGTSAYPVNYIDISRNYIITGDSNGGTLGIEIYNNGPTPSVGFAQFTVNGNIVRGENSSSANTYPTWGISVAGGGGHDGAITGNTIRWVGAYGIELAASQNVSIVGNTMEDGAGISILAAAPALASGSVHLKNVTVTGNTVKNPIRYNQTIAANQAIQLYSELAHTAAEVVVSNNTILIEDGTYTYHGMLFQCNGSSGSFANLSITGNTIIGPGSGSMDKGIILEVDSPCPISGVTLTGNRFDNLLQAVSGTDQTTSIVTDNSYGTVGSRYGAGLSATTPYWELIPGSIPSALTNTMQWTSYTPTVGVAMGSTVMSSSVEGRYLQVGTVVYIRIFATVTISTATSSEINFTIPVVPASGTNQMMPVMVFNNALGTTRLSGAAISSTTKVSVYTDSSKFPTATAMNVRINGVYEAAALVAP